MDPEKANSPHDMNDLFDYDVGLDDIFEGNAAPTANADISKPPAADSSALGLGLDEEVQVTKKRKPIAKLDEGRLLSQPGIPKLRRAAKQKLKFRGKGHEFSDAARLLNFYQLWLDDLFPRAKFADGLAIIEKLGHSKRIQTMRREWIDEEKPSYFDDRETSRDIPDTRDLFTGSSSSLNGKTADESRDSGPSRPPQDGSAVIDSELFIPGAGGESRPTASHPEPDDDDLEDLLRDQGEQLSGAISEQTLRAPHSGHDEFDAENEAMNELGV